MSSSQPLLIRAAADGDTEAVRRLIARGVDVNGRSGGGQTALILAIIGGHEKVVHILRTAGADPRLRDRLGLTAFDWAERRGFHDLAKLFEEECRDLGPAEPSAGEVAPLRPEPEQTSARASRPEDRSQRWLSGMKKRWQEELLKQNSPGAMTSMPSVEATPPGQTRPPILEPQRDITPRTVPPVEHKQTKPVQSSQAISPPPPIPKAPVAIPDHSPTKTTASSYRQQDSSKSQQVPVQQVPVQQVPANDDSISLISTSKSSYRKFFIWFSFAFVLAIACAGTFYLFRYLSSTATSVESVVIEQPAPEPGVEPKNLPVLSEELAGKELSLREPEYPARAKTRGVGGTVVVRVRVNKRGRVVLARSSAGDWQLRAAAVNAAIKSTFDPEKLPERDTQGTISYNFIP